MKLPEIFASGQTVDGLHMDFLLEHPLTQALNARERYSREWDEDAHPRGQPDNAGQFASKNRGKTSAAKYRPYPGPLYLTGAHSDASKAAAKQYPELGLLVTPATRQYLKHLDHYETFAVDNGVFGGHFDPDKFRSLLDDISKDGLARQQCMFVVAPDVFDRKTMRGDPLATIEKSKPWFKEIQDRGLPAALVAQDGLEDHLDKIPWDDFDALFIGGGDEFKEGYRDDPLFNADKRKRWLKMIETAKEKGKHIHVGRVNGLRRYEIAKEIGADSVDGTYLAFGPKKNTPKMISWMDTLANDSRDTDTLRRDVVMADLENRPRPDYAGTEDYRRTQQHGGVMSHPLTDALNSALRTSQATHEPYALTARLTAEWIERYAMQAQWDEQKHPRNHGKFAPKGSGTTGAAAKPASPGKAGKQQPLALHDAPAAAPKKPAKPAATQAEEPFTLGQAPKQSPKANFPQAHQHQTNLWHGMHDQPGQKKMFKDMDAGVQPSKPQPEQPKPANVSAKTAEDAQLDAPKTAPPPGPHYAPDPHAVNPKTGMTEAARVGVPGDSMPPPPKIGRLANLTPDERGVEASFADEFERDPDAMADRMIAMMADRNGEYIVGDNAHTFSTDEAKMLFPDWAGPPIKDAEGKPVLNDATKAFRAKYNTMLHQTANALAKRAFVRYLDNVVSKLPPEQRSVMVTAGGVAAGKGYAIGKVPAVKAINDAASAAWDTAGEQNSTELDWVRDQCAKRGIKMHAVYVHADPVGIWDNPAGGVIERAEKKGRMVDAKAFADSYTIGAKNFDAFSKRNGNNPNVQCSIISNIRGQDPKQLPSLPPEVLNTDGEALYQHCLHKLAAAPVSEPVKQGGSAGVRIWGGPQIAGQKTAV